jgi:hypothetical protein
VDGCARRRRAQAGEPATALTRRYFFFALFAFRFAQ